MRCLFIDYGATNIKSCIYDTTLDKFQDFRAHKCPGNISIYPEYVISIKSLSSITRSIFTGRDFESVFMSTQMHGFSLCDGENVGDYISWRDERGDIHSEITCYEDSGITPRKGLPVYNMLLSVNSDASDNIRVLSLPEAIIKHIGSFYDLCHTTVSCGYGTHVLETGVVSKGVQEFLGNNIVFPKTTFDIEPVGSFDIKGEQVPVFSPVGDLQCAVLGSGLQEKQVSINLGTGSQVSMISNVRNCSTDNRSFFENRVLNTITHIPSGRAINSFLSFMGTMGYKKDFWKIIKNSSVDDIMSSTMDISLGTFGGSSGYISGLREQSMTSYNLEMSIIRSYVLQYKDHIKKFDANSVMLSGGIVKNCPVIADVFRVVCDLPVEVNTTSIEETFLGLKTLTRYAL